MKMHSMHALIPVGTFCIAALTGRLRAEEPITVLAVPASRTLVQFCGDIADFFPSRVVLVAYPERGSAARQGLHQWDRGAWRWRSMDWSEWQAGPAPGVSRLVAVVHDTDVAREVVGGARWASQVCQLDRRGLHELANELHAIFGFSTPQWRFLAGRYGLKLRDRNAERRRLGRYGAKRPTPFAPADAFDVDDVAREMERVETPWSPEADSLPTEAPAETETMAVPATGEAAAGGREEQRVTMPAPPPGLEDELAPPIDTMMVPESPDPSSK